MQNNKCQCVIAKLHKQTAVWVWTYFPTPARSPAATPLGNRVTLYLTPFSLTDGHFWDLTGQDDIQT